MRPSLRRLRALAIQLLTLSVIARRANAAPKVCLLMYQLADNNLEWFLRQDNHELIRSPAIKSDNLATWVYFDGRDRTGSDGDITEPLQEVWVEDGSELVAEKYDGSRYLTYDHGLSKMIVKKSLPGEQNSDHPQTVFDFFFYALEDCVEKGAEEFIGIFSSHGAGFAGYGSDENISRRQLIQKNRSISNSLEAALALVNGSPSRFDVLGFDACLMSSLVVLKEYSSVTKFFLASEGTEPGHGWAYQQLSDVGSALDLAKDIHLNYLEQMQGRYHRAPKMLSIVDLTAFDSFHVAIEELASELDALLQADNDPEFFSLLARSRAASVALESFLDDPGTENPSAVDIGSFLLSFRTMCNPKDGSALRTSLNRALNTYESMFVAHGTGPGTQSVTGMHAMWPFRKSYKESPGLFQYYLLGDTDVTKNAPHWFSFVKTYLNSDTPKNTDGIGKICVSSSNPYTPSNDPGDGDIFNSTDAANEATSADEQDTQPGDDKKLLINPTVSDTGNNIIASSEITINTDYVLIEVGIDATSLLGRRRLVEGPNTLKPLTDMASVGNLRPHLARGDSHRYRPGRRRTVEGNYFLFFLGSVLGTYENATYTGVWKGKTFYAIGDEDNFTPVYCKDAGNGARSIPIVYFPASVRIRSDMLPIGTSIEDAKQLGGVMGALEFGVDVDTGEVQTELSLMGNSASTSDSTISEIPPGAGGSIVPILYVEGTVAGTSYDVFLGGFDTSILQWEEGYSITVTPISAETYIEALGVSDLIIDITAFDFDVFVPEDPSLEGVDFATFSIDVTHSGAPAASSTWLYVMAFGVSAGGLLFL